MYKGIRKIENVIDYIESKLTSEPDCNVMAAMMNLSVYEFRRIFAFVVGCPVSEYIRKRKLSLAATELMKNEKANILDISQKYGYSNQSAFTRAFCEQHGVSPSVCMHEKTAINIFTRPKFELSVMGGENIPFEIKKTDGFYIKGFCGASNISDTCCCEDVWNAFYESGTEISGDEIYASYSNQANDVKCCIGEIGSEGEWIPQTHWACFKMNTVDDSIVNEKYSKIIYEWLPSANLERNEKIPTVEIYPSDMSEDGFEWEIRIPIK